MHATKEKAIFLAISLCLMLDYASSFTKCSRNSSWEPDCERSCDSMKLCKSYPMQECYCKESYYRDRKNGACLKRKQCPANDGKCPVNSSPQQQCERVCGYDSCVSPPNQMCYCDNGFFRDLITYKCVPEDDCTQNPDIDGCVQWTSSSRTCEATCGQLSCKRRIGRYCYCKISRYRDLTDGTCVRIDECPIAKCSSKLTCEKSCGSTACRKVQRDCYCKNSYYRHPVTMECVRPEDCNRRKSTTRAAKKRRTRRTTKARSYLLTTLTTQGLRPTIFTIDTNSVILQYINISRITPRPT